MAERPKILVADADQRMVQSVKVLAQMMGYEVVSTTFGEETLRLAELHGPALIVLDIKLPDADGRDLLRELKEHPRLSSIPVVMWSGRDYESDRVIAIELGAAAYMPKEEGGMHTALLQIERILKQRSKRSA